MLSRKESPSVGRRLGKSKLLVWMGIVAWTDPKIFAFRDDKELCTYNMEWLVRQCWTLLALAILPGFISLQDAPNCASTYSEPDGQPIGGGAVQI